MLPGEIADQRRSDGNVAGEILQASLDSLSAHVVILDKTGAIAAANVAWQRFATANGLTGYPIGCRASCQALYDCWLSSCPQTNAIQEGLASVLSGLHAKMRQLYSWQAADSVRWLELRASRVNRKRETYVVLISEDVTAIRDAEQALGEAAEHLLTVQEQERQRIAEELHDSTAQHVVAAGLNLMGLRSRIDGRSDLREFLERIETSLDEASKELRSLTYLMHPPYLEGAGLAATLGRYVEGFGKRTGLRTRLRIGQGIDDTPLVVQRPLFRIIQEALANVHRHASASGVSVDLRFILERLHLVVRDDGRGMEGLTHRGQKRSEPSCPGVGIAGMRARLQQFGGRLVIKSGSRGTTFHAIVPIVAHASRNA